MPEEEILEVPTENGPGPEISAGDRRPKTFGEKLVGIDFNPAGRQDVATVKAKFAEIADILDEHFKQSNQSMEVMPIVATHAFTSLLQSQMAAVKALTYND